jgi:hypothetical protein
MEVGARRGAHFQLVTQRDVAPQVIVELEIPWSRDRFVSCGIQQQSKSQNMKTRDPKTKSITRIDMKTKRLGNSITAIGFD